MIWFYQTSNEITKTRTAVCRYGHDPLQPSFARRKNCATVSPWAFWLYARGWLILSSSSLAFCEKKPSVNWLTAVPISSTTAFCAFLMAISGFTSLLNSYVGSISRVHASLCTILRGREFSANLQHSDVLLGWNSCFFGQFCLAPPSDLPVLFEICSHHFSDICHRQSIFPLSRSTAQRTIYFRAIICLDYLQL